MISCCHWLKPLPPAPVYKTSLQSLHNVSKDLQSVTGRLLQVLDTKGYSAQTLRTCIPTKIATMTRTFPVTLSLGWCWRTCYGLLSIGNDGEVSPGIAKVGALKTITLPGYSTCAGAQIHSGRK